MNEEYGEEVSLIGDDSEARAASHDAWCSHGSNHTGGEGGVLSFVRREIVSFGRTPRCGIAREGAVWLCVSSVCGGWLTGKQAHWRFSVPVVLPPSMMLRHGVTWLHVLTLCVVGADRAPRVDLTSAGSINNPLPEPPPLPLPWWRFKKRVEPPLPSLVPSPAAVDKPHRSGGGGMSIQSAWTLSFSVVLSAVLVQTAEVEWLPSAAPAFVRELLVLWTSIRPQHILLMTTACAFCMYGASDVLSQVLTTRSPHKGASSRVRIDLRRALRSGFCSSMLSGLLACFYFAWLDRVFRDAPRWLAPERSWAAFGAFASLVPAVCKMLVDVGVYEPVYDTCYLTMQSVLRGDKDLSTLRTELRKVPAVWAMAPRYWALVDLINFSCVPTRFRPLYNACFSIPWSIYLSTMANSQRREHKPATAATEAGQASIGAAA